MDQDPKTPPQTFHREGGVTQPAPKPAPKPAEETGMLGEAAKNGEAGASVESDGDRADDKDGGMLGQG
ncbi:hypothetical protein ABOZ73_11690 [Caulobacter sp. 73W]|uniref:Tat pathway signal protein n=1 Tax=Caulobacter sp. 73W TaxID=3161137 RepID=A0AB39KPG6_9CAUL